MINKIIFSVFVVFLGVICAVVPAVSYAQECQIAKQEILTLKEPDFTTPKQWEATYGKDGMEQFTGVALPLSGKGASMQEGAGQDVNVVVAGSYAGKPSGEDKPSILSPLLAHLDKRGEPSWLVRKPTSGNQTVEEFFKTKSGYVLFGDVSRYRKTDGVYVARYNAKGGKISERGIFPEEGNLKARGIVETLNGDGFVIAVEQTMPNDPSYSKALLYKVLTDGTLVWKKSYSPGARAVFHDVTLSPFGGYLISGEIEGEDGRLAAWLLHMNENGSLNWQREYKRGNAARFNKALVQRDSVGFSQAESQGQVVVIGDIDPHGAQNNKSAWVMVMDGAGNTIWERYLQANYKISAQDMFMYPDGRLFVLADFYPVRPSIKQRLQGERPRGHSRVLAFSPRGRLLDVKSYSAGVHAHALAMTPDAQGSILVAGSLQQKLPEGMDLEATPGAVFDGWVFQTPPIDDYADPCAPSDPDF